MSLVSSPSFFPPAWPHVAKLRPYSCSLWHNCLVARGGLLRSLIGGSPFAGGGVLQLRGPGFKTRRLHNFFLSLSQIIRRFLSFIFKLNDIIIFKKKLVVNVNNFLFKKKNGRFNSTFKSRKRHLDGTSDPAGYIFILEMRICFQWFPLAGFCPRCWAISISSTVSTPPGGLTTVETLMTEGKGTQFRCGMDCD